MKTFNLHGVTGPHEDCEVVTHVPESPTQALILMHGRGSSGDNIMQIARHVPRSVVVLAPTAHNNTWYPYRFLEEKSKNEPHLSSALSVIDALLSHVKIEYGIEHKNCTLGGFSQGACLVSEYVLQHPQKYKGICVCSGGFIGSDAEVTMQLSGDMMRTPVYLGCDIDDQHIPIERVEATAHACTVQNADVTLRKYENLGHTIHPEGFEFLARVLG